MLGAGLVPGVGRLRPGPRCPSCGGGRPAFASSRTGPGYGETTVTGSPSEFAKVLRSEQVGRDRASNQNLLVTDFVHFALFLADVGRLDVTLRERSLSVPSHRARKGSARVDTGRPTALVYNLIGKAMP